MKYHKHTGLKKSHLITQKHKDKSTQQYHLKSLIGKTQFITKEVKIKGIEKLRVLFIKNNWNLEEHQHYQIYIKVCEFIENNYNEK